MNIALQLDKYKIPNVRTIKRIPGIDTIQSKKIGKLFQIKYFIDIGKGPKMFGFSSRNSNFKKIYSFDIYDLALRITGSMVLKANISDQEIITIITKTIKSITYKKPKLIKESISLIENFDKDMGSIMAMMKIVYGIMIAIPVILGLRNLLVTFKNWYEEEVVTPKIENEINSALFKTQKKDDSAFDIYNHLVDYINFIINKKANALIVYGPPGMSKTYTIRRTLYFSNKQAGKDYSIEKGATLGLLATYSLLYKNRNKILILDDFDTPLLDTDIVNLLKSITDTYQKRIVSLPREKVLSSGSSKIIGVPEKFEYKGQLIIVTNLKRSQLDNALVSRAPAIEIKYNTKEILKSTEKLLKYVNPVIPLKLKQEAYNYIVLLYKNDKNIIVSFRSIKAAVEARAGNPKNWKEMVRTIVNYQGKNITENYLKDLQG